MTASRVLLALSLMFIAVSAFPAAWRLVDGSGPAPLSASYVGGFVGMLSLVLSFVVGGLEARLARLERDRPRTAVNDAEPGAAPDPAAR